ncbi:MAG: hypothetical protein WCF19_07540 [Chlamydiales bacterium]
MEKLDKRQILTASDFSACPIWVWDDTREYKIPLITQDDNLENFDVFFIKAEFKTNDHCFDGYLVGNNDFYAFTLFCCGNVKFNIHAAELNRSSVEEVFRALNCEPFKFFPLEYQSEVVLKDKCKIAGVLNFPT